jgi:hypothetical protein
MKWERLKLSNVNANNDFVTLVYIPFVSKFRQFTLLHTPFPSGIPGLLNDSSTEHNSPHHPGSADGGIDHRPFIQRYGAR